MDIVELNPGLISVAAPLLDRQDGARFAISIAGPGARIRGEKLETVKEQIRQAAKRISLSLGYCK